MPKPDVCWRYLEPLLQVCGFFSAIILWIRAGQPPFGRAARKLILFGELRWRSCSAADHSCKWQLWTAVDSCGQNAPHYPQWFNSALLTSVPQVSESLSNVLRCGCPANRAGIYHPLEVAGAGNLNAPDTSRILSMTTLPCGDLPNKALLRPNCELCSLTPHPGLDFCPHCHRELPGGNVLAPEPIPETTHLVRKQDAVCCGVCSNGVWCPCERTDPFERRGEWVPLPQDLVVLHPGTRAVCLACGDEMRCGH